MSIGGGKSLIINFSDSVEAGVLDSLLIVNAP